MNNYIVILNYLIDKPLSFIAFAIGRLPLWVLFYMFAIHKISVPMFITGIIIIYLSRCYFDVEIFSVNPFYALFSSIFYSIYKPIVFLSTLLIIIASLYYFLFTGNSIIIVLTILLAVIFLTGISVFFRKDYFKNLWKIQNAPQINQSFFKAILIEILWLIVITTPINISLFGVIIIYILEIKNLTIEFESFI